MIFSPLFSRVRCRHFSLRAFLTHCIHRHSSHFAFIIHWEFGLQSISINLLSPSPCFPRVPLFSLQPLVFLLTPAWLWHTRPLLLGLFGDGSSSQYQLARPMDLATTLRTYSRTDGTTRKDEDERCVLYYHLCIPGNLTTHTMISRIYPFYDEYSYRYSHHRIFRASPYQNVMDISHDFSSVTTFRRSSYRPRSCSISIVASNILSSARWNQHVYHILFRTNNSVYVLLLPIVSVPLCVPYPLYPTE